MADLNGFRRSPNIEDRRREHYYRNLVRGPFGTFGETPNVFDGEGTMANLNNLRDFMPSQRTSAAKALGLDELEHSLLIQQQNNAVRSALDNYPVRIPGDNDPNGPPVRIDNRPPGPVSPLKTSEKPMGFMSALRPGPIGLGSSIWDLSYPFTQDKNFPGVAATRHANAEKLRQAYLAHRNDPVMQSATKPIFGGASTADILGAANRFMRDPYGVNSANAAPAPQAPTGPTPGPAPSPSPPPQAPAAPPASPFSAAANAIVAHNNQPSVPLGSPPPSPRTGDDAAPLAALPMAPHVPLPMARPVQAPQMAPHVPMPMARPSQAPQPQQDAGGPSGGGLGGFFANNTAMMRDPVSGDFIDPKAAAMAQANTTGPELIQKFMNMLHKGTS